MSRLWRSAVGGRGRPYSRRAQAEDPPVMFTEVINGVDLHGIRRR